MTAYLSDQVFTVTPWVQVERLLQFGGTEPVARAQDFVPNAVSDAAVHACIFANARIVYTMVHATLTSGNATKRQPALYVLAALLSHAATPTPIKHIIVQDTLVLVSSTTDFFTLLGYVTKMRGTGRTVRRIIQAWYARPPAELAYQLVKYRQREGWTHKDALALGHVKGDTLGASAALIQYAVAAAKGQPTVFDSDMPIDDAHQMVWAFVQLQQITIDQEIQAALWIMEYRLPWESVPTALLASPLVWQSLMGHIPLGALVRNLGRLTKLGLLAADMLTTQHVITQLRNVDAMRRARMHPLGLFQARITYAQGHGDKGALTWNPMPDIVAALDQAVLDAFLVVQPTNRRVLVAIDVSGSMQGAMVAGLTGVTAASAATIMALLLLRTEPFAHTVMFQRTLAMAPLHAGMLPGEAIAAMARVQWDGAGTDCAAPMMYALQHRIAVDTFIVFTDSETNQSALSPADALVQYNEAMGIRAQLIVVGFSATAISIADPANPCMLDIVGFTPDIAEMMHTFMVNG